ncbi:MAG TPA: FG-GAP repeat protein, partial [Chthoniobacteraceae bacterium]|nr:FG-GAP repeat protein [Chthoniobacteraceae bacterium]
MKLLRALSFVCIVAWFSGLPAVAESVHYTIDPSQSFLTMSGDFAGAPLVPQAPGTDSAPYFLALNGDLDGTSLALDTSHAASLFQSVVLLPGRMDGDTDISYGLKAQSPALGQVLVSTTRLSFYFSTQWRPPLDVADGSFQPSDVGFFLSDGAFYYSTAAVPRQYVDLHGYGAPNRATAPGTLKRIGHLETLTIPVATTFSVSTPDGNVTLSFAGQIVATRILPAAVLRSSSPNLFGLSVATDAHTLLVGAPATDGTKGAVHLYYRAGDGFSEWREHQVLRPTYPRPTLMFGFALSLDNNIAAIASYHSPVFIFERTQPGDLWIQTAALETPDDTSFSGGNNLSLNQGVLAVGVNTAGSSEQGLVQIYQRDPSRAWHFVTAVRADDAEDGALFGSSVALLGEFLVVGAPGAANGSGAVYVFRRNGATWRQVQKILPPQPIPNGEFGHSVATNIGQIIISEPGDGQISDTPGRVYLYELKGIVHDDEWLLKHELIPNEPLPAKSRFGHRVGIDGNNRDIVVTQIQSAATPDTQPPGSAYDFTLGTTGWPQRLKLAPTAHDYPSS